MSEPTERSEVEEPAAPRREPRQLKLRHVIGVAVVTALCMGPVSAFANHQFPDVPNSNLFHDQIDWMSDTGITTGFPDGTFKPNANVTRGQMSAFMFRLYNLQAGLTAVDGGTDGGAVGGVGNIDVWETVNNLSTTVTIPAGTTGRVTGTFSSELACENGDNSFAIVVIRTQCSVRFMLNGVEMTPGVQTLRFSEDAATDGDLALDFSTHTAQAFSAIVGPGSYTVTVQMMANDADNNGDPGDDALVMDVASHTLKTEVHLNDRFLL